MENITAYSIEFIKDPFGIVDGERYEFILDFEVDEEDELYTPSGIYLRVIYGVKADSQGIVKHHILERGTDKYLDFELEDEELQEIESFCKEHLSEAQV
ncbi:hypothetical protein J2Z69_001368 [Paenibacillus shirakamiensis]|uniref:Pullulanase n=1 Tax=Paenibacillus shirakamiensis TaxID=1265935 RepID=A0ABS4JF58_9BACL|nr:DUF6509 family protein [Paenibacillus shirakamiensis]MBP2000349.1 hypothetical protein [Paenibacillus shirakamiensis]